MCLMSLVKCWGFISKVGMCRPKLVETQPSGNSLSVVGNCRWLFGEVLRLDREDQHS